MLKRIVSMVISALIFITGLILTDLYIPYMAERLGYEISGSIFGLSFGNIALAVPGIFLFGWLALVLAPVFTNALFNYSERVATSLSGMPTSDIMIIIMGAGIGLILANLIGAPFSHLPVIGDYIPIFLSLLLSVVGVKLALRKSNDIISFFYRFPLRRQGRAQDSDPLNGSPAGDRLYSINKLLDTSVIIDGRIMDILAAGFLDGRLLIPNFVIGELQQLADSADDMKRAKGRRGLDLIQDLQTSYKEQVSVINNDYEDISEVDAKLVRLAREYETAVITNDFNLNKVAVIQGIKVLSIHELANAIKPVVMSGEEMSVALVKEGKEAGQAIAYLDDGTMIVVENGRRHVGSAVTVVVSSVLQTAAGRMIFARMK